MFIPTQMQSLFKCTMFFLVSFQMTYRAHKNWVFPTVIRVYMLASAVSHIHWLCFYFFFRSSFPSLFHSLSPSFSFFLLCFNCITFFPLKICFYSFTFCLVRFYVDTSQFFFFHHHLFPVFVCFFRITKKKMKEERKSDALPLTVTRTEHESVGNSSTSVECR